MRQSYYDNHFDGIIVTTNGSIYNNVHKNKQAL